MTVINSTMAICPTLSKPLNEEIVKAPMILLAIRFFWYQWWVWEGKANLVVIVSSENTVSAIHQVHHGNINCVSGCVKTLKQSKLLQKEQIALLCVSIYCHPCYWKLDLVWHKVVSQHWGGNSTPENQQSIKPALGSSWVILPYRSNKTTSWHTYT